MTEIGFVGLGAMGRPMAANLLAAGYELAVHDRDRASAASLSDRAVTVCGSAGEVAQGCEFVITMLPDSPDVRAAVLGPDGVAAGAKPGTVVIDMSSISPLVAQQVGEQLSLGGVEFLDAPVSGGTTGAERGTLSIMVGGADEVVERALPLFETLGERITHMGGSGTGQAAKLCNQVAVALNVQAVCEALSLGRAAGIDVWKLRDVMMAGAASSWILEEFGAQMIEGDTRPGFRIALQLKDLRLAAEFAHEQGVPTPGAALASNLYLEARAHGEDDNGNHAMFRVYERLSNQAPGSSAP